jgi:uncharacterized protein YjiS (DUF1127 family)
MHSWRAEITLTVPVFFFYFFCNTETRQGCSDPHEGEKDMINSEFSSPIPGLSLEDQNRFYAEARRQQALTVAAYVGKAVKAIGIFFNALTDAIVRARQLAELSQLSDRQLADIGIKRSDIPRVVVGEPVGGHRISVPGLKGWTPSTASNDWTGSAAA